jgi:hypothetical protein
MNIQNNPQLLNTVVSGTGMSSPRIPNVILGKQKIGGYAAGDLLDANAVIDLITKVLTEGIDSMLRNITSEDIANGTIKLEDLNEEVTYKLNSVYDTSESALYVNNFTVNN